MNMQPSPHPLKEMELRQLAECSGCRRKLGQTAMPLILWKVSLERHMIKQGAIHRQTGLSAMLGNSHLAQVMGPDEDMTSLLSEVGTVMVCEECATHPSLLVCALLPEEGASRT